MWGPMALRKWRTRHGSFSSNELQVTGVTLGNGSHPIVRHLTEQETGGDCGPPKSECMGFRLPRGTGEGAAPHGSLGWAHPDPVRFAGCR